MPLSVRYLHNWQDTKSLVYTLNLGSDTGFEFLVNLAVPVCPYLSKIVATFMYLHNNVPFGAKQDFLKNKTALLPSTSLVNF